MTKMAVTGGDGFLGWHAYVVAQGRGIRLRQIPVGEFFEPGQARAAVSSSSRLIHLAGVNRGSDEEVKDGNVRFAEQIAAALKEADDPPGTVVYANSIQADTANTYGQAKARAAEVLAAAADHVGAEFVDIRLPNLFGEHGRPFYNAVTATFCHLLAQGGEPEVKDDKLLPLLHAQNAADLLLGFKPGSDLPALTESETVSGLLRRLARMARVYQAGQIPDVSSSFERDLFNTYRSYTFETLIPIRLTRHADARGVFFEVIRSHGGSGQTSFSTTAPGIVRGDHYHRRKIERFTVLAGQATISLRRLLTDQIHSFAVSGDQPVAIDMPTGWTHNIVNTGNTDLYTLFWTNDLFDPADPDTIPEPVRREGD